jgi:hypothetical protein
MTDKTENPAEIYLITDTEGDLVWCDTPAPGEGMREEDATRYVREDIYLALQAQVKQLKCELTLSTDQNDLLLDEFVRVKLLTKNKEIHQLCERAHIRMRQRVPVIERNFNQAQEIKELKAQVEKLKERNRKLDVDLLRALFYAPSSPVSAQKAQEIEVWYGKFKQVVLAAKGGE